MNHFFNVFCLFFRDVTSSQRNQNYKKFEPPNSKLIVITKNRVKFPYRDNQVNEKSAQISIIDITSARQLATKFYFCQ